MPKIIQPIEPKIIQQFVPKIIQPIVPKIIQPEIAHMPKIIQQESITQQLGEVSVHWAKCPAQWIGEVSFSVLLASNLSAHGPYFEYEDELLVSSCSMVGMAAPSITRARRMGVQQSGY